LYVLISTILDSSKWEDELYCTVLYRSKHSLNLVCS
jgi:hypothetical protein